MQGQNYYNQNGDIILQPRWYQKKLAILIVPFLFILAILVIILTLTNTEPTPTNQPLDNNIAEYLETKTPQRQLAEKKDRPHFGNEDAKLVIVEFSDFQCTVCQAEFPIIREITNKYSDDVLYIYRQYPIIDENSLAISQASLCAHAQDKFWQMHDKLFLSPGEYSQENIINIATQSGLDISKFNICMETEATKNMVLEDAQNGYTLGVEGTPTFFVNGNKLAGAVSKENWESIISKSLEVLK
jgi:protein-disulfide isomerase